MKEISNADHSEVFKILEWVAGGCKDSSSIKVANLIRKSKILGKKYANKKLRPTK